MKKKILYSRRIGIVDEPTDKGHIAIFGQTGSGKTALGEALCQQHFNAGWKVIFWDISRLENALMLFPCDQPVLQNVLMKCRRQPEAKKAEVLFPLVKKELIEKYVYKVPVNFKPFKLNFSSFGEKEFEVLLGGTSEGGERILESLFTIKWGSPEELESALNKLQRGAETLNALDEEDNYVNIGDKRIYRNLNRTFASLITKNILCADSSEYALNLDELMSDNKVISCFSGFSCNDEEEFMLVFVNVMKKILNMRLTKKYPPLLIYIPEVSNYAGNTQSTFISKKLIRRFLKESRDAGIRMIIDTQRPQDVDSSVRNQATIVYVGRMQKESVDFIDKNVMEIPRINNVFWRIPYLEIGRFLKVWDNGRGWRYPLFVAPPESRKKEANEDIFDYYERKGIEFKEIVDESSHKQKIMLMSQIKKMNENKLDEENNNSNKVNEEWRVGT